MTPIARTQALRVLLVEDDEVDIENVAGYILKPITLRDFITTLDTVEAYWRLQEFP